jgi:predicted metal-dependent peptidase
MKLTAEQRIERAHVKLMQSKNFCYFAGVFMIGKVDVSDTLKTASTNGRDVTYGREFVDILSDKQLAFLVIHEAMHKAYRHLTVWQKIAREDRQLANAAMDYVINLQIRDADPHEEEVAMPRKPSGELLGLYDDKYRGLDTHQVYMLLKEEGGGGGGTGGDDDGDGDGSEQGNGLGGGGSGQSDESSDGLDEHDWDGAESIDGEAKEELDREIDSALREGSILAGKMKGNVPREINDLLHPKVDWKEALRDFIKVATRGGDQSTWRRPNRRFLANGIIMPSTESYRAETFVLGVDTSGSIGGAELTAFLSEVKAICEEVTPQKLELLYWDTHVAGRETYSGAEMETLTDTTKPKGGGGTTPGCVPKYMIEHRIEPQCTIMLTDGYFFGGGCGDWAGVNSPVLWCVKGNKQFVPTHGQAILVEGL